MPMSFERQLDVFEKWLRGKGRKVPYYTNAYLYEKADFFRLKVATAWGKETSSTQLVEGIRSRMAAHSAASRSKNALLRKAAKAKAAEELRAQLALEVREPEFKLT